jgi:hypothetical protein
VRAKYLAYSSLVLSLLSLLFAVEWWQTVISSILIFAIITALLIDKKKRSEQQ